MSNMIFSGTLINYFMTACFLLSTLYGINFYYTNTEADVVLLGVNDANDLDSTVVTPEHDLNCGFWCNFKNNIYGVGSSGIDAFLETMSIVNPFVFVKIFVYDNTPYEVFNAINLFFLRPIGWIFTVLTADYIINKLKGISG